MKGSGEDCRVQWNLSPVLPFPILQETCSWKKSSVIGSSTGSKEEEGKEERKERSGGRKEEGRQKAGRKEGRKKIRDKETKKKQTAM